MTTAPSTRPTGTSAGSDALRALYADWSEIIATTPGLTMRLFRSIFDEWHQPTREPEDVTYREETVGGVPGIWALPAGADTSQVLLYTARRRLRRRLGVEPPQARRARRQGARRHRVRPGLPPGPRAPAPRAGRGRRRGFIALTERGIAPADITTIGDSAGGNLAIAIALALRDQGRPLPGRVIAFSPWLDMENTGETLVTNDATDALITVPLLEGMIAGVLADGTIDPRTPLANPLLRRLRRLPAGSTSTPARRSRWSTTPPGSPRRPRQRGRRHPLGRRRACSTSSRSSPATRPRPTTRSPRSPSGTRLTADR